MFQEVDYLGQGAFGDVLKVKCLQSTSLSEDGASRIKMDPSTVKRAKQERIKAEIVVGGGASSVNTQQNCIDKPLFEDENYVIKVINVANLNQKAQFDALNEIETMQVMNSPFVVGYYDSFIDDDDEEPKINIVIEYCPNGDLSNFITKQSTLGTTGTQSTAVGGQLKKDETIRYFNENLVWKIFINLCLGLEHMHSKNYIHRDLKTLNIFMAKENVAKIGDLGCALNLSKLKPLKKQNESNIKDIEMVVEPSEEGIESPRYLFDEGDDQNLLSLNETNLLSSLHSSEKKEEQKENKKQISVQQLTIENQEDTAGCPESELDDENPVGTPYYLSPEIWKEKRYSRASDIWALGVILYELLNLKKPFPAQDKDELINKVYTQQPEKMRAGISQAFQILVQGMLKREAKKRLTIEEIIFSEDFQKMSQKLKINLPLKLNKEKLQQKIIANQLQNTDVKLTQFLEKLFEKELKTINNLPTLQKVNSQGMQTQNLSNLKQKQQQQVIQKQTSKVESLVKRASLKIQSKDQKTNQKSSSSMSTMSNNDKKIQDKTTGKFSKQDCDLEKKTPANLKEESKNNDTTKDSIGFKKVNSSSNDLLKPESKELQSVSSSNTARTKNFASSKLSQQSNKLQSQQSIGTEDSKNDADQVNRTKSSLGVNFDQKSHGLSAVSSQASVAKGKVNQFVKQNTSVQSSLKKGKDVEDSGTASKLSLPATSSIVTTPRGQEKPGTTGKRDVFSKKNSCASSQGTALGTIFSSEAQRNSKIFGDLVQSQGNTNFHKKKDSIDQNKPKHNFKGGLKNNEQQQEVIAQKQVETLQKKDISSKNSADATMDIEERLSCQNSPDQIQKHNFIKSDDKQIQADSKINKIQQPLEQKKEEEKQKLKQTEKQQIDTVSNNSQVIKFEYGGESPSILDDEEIRTSKVKDQQKKDLQKDQKNLKSSIIPRNSQISEAALASQLRLNKGKVSEKESTKVGEKDSIKPGQKRQSLKEHKIEKIEDGKYQLSKLSRESMGGQEEKKKTGSASKNKNVQFRNSIVVNPIAKLNQDNRRVTIAGTKNQNTSRPSMLTQRKTEDNPFEKAESIKSKNLLSVRIDPKKDNKKDKLSAGLPVKNKIEKQSKCPSLNSSQKSSKSFVNRGPPVTRQKTFAKKALQKNLMVTEGSDDERMNPFASVQEPEICPFDNHNESDRKKSANTSGDSLGNPPNIDNEPVSASRQMEYKALRSVRIPNDNKIENSPQKVIVLDQQDVKQPLSTRSGAGKSFQAFLQAHNFAGGTRPTSSTIKISSSNLSKELIDEPNSINSTEVQEQKNAFNDFKERMLRNSKSQNKNESAAEIFENEQNQNNTDTYMQQKAQFGLKMSVISESPATITSMSSSQIDGDYVKNEKVIKLNQKTLSGKVELKSNLKDDSPIKQESPFKQSFAEKSPNKHVQPLQVSELKKIDQKDQKAFNLEKVLKQNKEDNQPEVTIEWTDYENEVQEIPQRQQIEQEHQFMSPAFARKPVNNQPIEIPQPVMNKQKSESDFQGPPSLQFAEGRKRLGTLATPSRLKVIEEQKQENEKETRQPEEKKNTKSNLNQSRLSQKADQISPQTTPLRGLKKKESTAKQEPQKLDTPKTTAVNKNKK